MTTKGTALITGASTGIGAIYADRLAKRGYDLILVARNRDKLQALASSIADETGRTVEVLAADLGKAEGLHAVETVLRQDASITALVNNAGIGTHTTLLDSDVDRMEAMVRPERDGFDAPHLCGRARFRGTRWGHHHQHRLDRGARAGAAQRRLWRHEGLRSGLHDLAQP